MCRVAFGLMSIGCSNILFLYSVFVVSFRYGIDFVFMMDCSALFLIGVKAFSKFDICLLHGFKES